MRFLASLGRRWQRRQANGAKDSRKTYGRAPGAQAPAASGVQPRGGRSPRPEPGLPTGARLDVEIPGGAEERAWRVVRAAYEERVPAPRERKPWRPVLALAAVAVVAGVVASPPGQAVLDSIREAVGVEQAEEALFSLPTSGRLLVQSDDGPWIVQADGSKRRLGSWREASWSPFGRFVVVARRNELAALEPDGDVRWSLARPGVRLPRWGGTPTDTRIAYVSRDSLRLVAGDGTGDRLLERRVAAVAPAWRPGSGFVLAYADRSGRVSILDVDEGRLIGRSGRGQVPRELVWSDDGRRLLAAAPQSVRLLDARGRLVTREGPSDGTTAIADRFEPGTSDVVEIRREGAGSNVFRWRDGRSVFRGTGEFRDLASSPDGKWLLITWPTADQWVFVRVSGKRKLAAVSGITRQFGGGAFPRIAGWCCSS